MLRRCRWSHDDWPPHAPTNRYINYTHSSVAAAARGVKGSTCHYAAILWTIMSIYCTMLVEFAYRHKVVISFTHEAHGASHTEASAGLPGAVAGDSVRTAQAGRPAAERGGARAARSARRGSRSGARSRPASAGLVERRVGSGTYVSGPRAAGRAVVRPADSRSGRDRHLRAGVSGDDGVAAGAHACAPVGQRQRRGSVEGRSRLAAVPPVHRAPRGRRVLRAARVHCSGGRTQSADRAGARRCAHPGRAARSDRDAVSRARPPRSCRHRQPPRRLPDHVDTCCGLGSRRVAFVAQPNAAATVDAREAGYREALYAAALPIDRALVRRLDPSDLEAVRAADGVGPARRGRVRERSHGRPADADAHQARVRRAQGSSGSSASTTWNLPRCCRCR